MKNNLTRIINILLKPVHKFKQLSLKKKLLLSIVIIICVLIGSVLFRGQNKPGFTLVKAEKSDIVETVEETGSITTSGKTDIYSPTKGIIEAVFVKNGDYVAKDQELFKVASTATQEEQQTAYANYLAAKVTLDDAQAAVNTLKATMISEWDTYYTLATGDHYENSDGTPREDQRSAAEFHVTQNEWLAAEKQFKEQQTAVSQAQAKTTATWLAYQATQNATVKATITGMVANLAVASGSSVLIQSTTSTPPVLTIASGVTPEIVVPLSESDIVKVFEGQEATVDVSAVDNHVYKGRVTRVDTFPTPLQGVMRYNAYIGLTDADEKIRSGMTVDVDIITNKVTDTLAVPNAAVKPYQGGRAVRVPADKGTVKYIPVEIGVKGREKTQILSGISEGTEVVTSLSNEQLKRPGLFGN